MFSHIFYYYREMDTMNMHILLSGVLHKSKKIRLVNGKESRTSFIIMPSHHTLSFQRRESYYHAWQRQVEFILDFAIENICSIFVARGQADGELRNPRRQIVLDGTDLTIPNLCSIRPGRQRTTKLSPSPCSPSPRWCSPLSAAESSSARAVVPPSLPDPPAAGRRAQRGWRSASPGEFPCSSIRSIIRGMFRISASSDYFPKYCRTQVNSSPVCYRFTFCNAFCEFGRMDRLVSRFLLGKMANIRALLVG